MWLYSQSSGALTHNGGTVGYGYSGFGAGRNNPEFQNVHAKGPTPRGLYAIGQLHDTSTHGPNVLPLTPHPENEMFGRSGFLIHGDSKVHPGAASIGCIILPASVRLAIARSGDTQLTVTL